MLMKLIIEAQELARRFNEDEAVWRAFEDTRALRRLLGSDTLLFGGHFGLSRLAGGGAGMSRSPRRRTFPPMKTVKPFPL
jgi:hypothetical protein